MCHSPEIKAAAMAELLQGQSINKVAEKYNIPAGTVRSWKQRDCPHATMADTAELKQRIGDKLVAYLEASLETLRIQQEFFRDTEWLRKQPASELAVLHGVTADKSIRLLEALSASQADSADGVEMESAG